MWRILVIDTHTLKDTLQIWVFRPNWTVMIWRIFLPPLTTQSSRILKLSSYVNFQTFIWFFACFVGLELVFLMHFSIFFSFSVVNVLFPGLNESVLHFRVILHNLSSKLVTLSRKAEWERKYWENASWLSNLASNGQKKNEIYILEKWCKIQMQIQLQIQMLQIQSAWL